MENKYQSVTITLSDGREGTFIGPVLITKEDYEKGIIPITPMVFTEPIEMPEGMRFESMEEFKKKEEAEKTNAKKA